MTALELREGQDGNTWMLQGIASKVGVPYKITDHLGSYVETVHRGAFTKTLSQSPAVRLLIAHNRMGPLLGRSGRNLHLSETRDGDLAFSAELAKDDPDCQAAASKVRNGLLDEVSFAFTIMDGNAGQTWSNDYKTRSIHRVDLNNGDVSLCVKGANPQTSVSIRAGDSPTGGRELAESIGLEFRGAVDLRVVETGVRAGKGRAVRGTDSGLSLPELEARNRSVALEQDAEMMLLKRRKLTARDHAELHERARWAADRTGASEGDVLALLEAAARESDLTLRDLRKRR